ncbi:MAG: ATP-grasp domain-containing protein [Candidatus Omnitrophica bacterium]|nr:ATP-grasp domain-containing protein [Candidatus Omnitrophota bacterium]
MAVLVVDAHFKQALVVTRSLGRRGVAVDLVAHSAYAPAFASKYCRRAFQSPVRKDQDAFVEFLLSLVKRERYDFILTCEDDSTRLLSEARSRFEPYTQVPLPPHDVVQLTLDKARMTQFAAAHGIPVPRTHYARTFEEIERAAQEIGRWPVVLKYPVGYGSRGVKPCHSRQALRQHYDACLQRFAPSTSSWLVQECIGGDNYGNHHLCRHGSTLVSTQARLLKTFPVAGGNTAKAVTVSEPDMEQSSRKLLAALGWHGVACLGFRYDPVSRRFVFLDVNPRFGGSLFLHVLGGVDFPYLLHCIVTGREVSVNGRFRTGVLYHSIFEENLQRAVLHPRYFLGYLWDCLDPRVRTEIAWSDLGPIPNQVRQALWRLQRRKETVAA